MKAFGAAAVLVSLAAAGLLTVLTRETSWWYDGVALPEGHWIAYGPKGENSPERLPPEAAALAREGDGIVCTEVWCRELRLGCRVLRLERSGMLLGRFSSGAFRFCWIMGGLVVTPLVFWGVALAVFSTFSRKGRPAS